MPSPTKKRRKDTQSKALEQQQQLEKDLQEREATVARERLALEAEKAHFASAAASNSNNDVFTLNVGGTCMDVSRRILTSVEGSLLAAQFSGRWDNCLTRDAHGHVFLDQSPALFQRLVNVLRDQANSQPGGGPTVRPPDQQVTFRNDRDTYEAFVRLAQYYGCTHAIWPCKLRYKRHDPSSPAAVATTVASATARIRPPSPPVFYYPNLEVSPPTCVTTTPITQQPILLTQIAPWHHKRYPRAVEIVLLNPTAEGHYHFGWGFRATTITTTSTTTTNSPFPYDNIHIHNSMLNNQHANHCVTVDTHRGMLQLNGQDVIRVNESIPLNFDTWPCTVRLEVKRSIFYFFFNGQCIATCNAFQSRNNNSSGGGGGGGVRRPTPVIVANCRWRISELILDA